MEFDKTIHEERTEEVGITQGFCNAVHIAKDLSEFILRGASGSTV